MFNYNTCIASKDSKQNEIIIALPWNKTVNKVVILVEIDHPRNWLSINVLFHDSRLRLVIRIKLFKLCTCTNTFTFLHCTPFVMNVVCAEKIRQMLFESVSLYTYSPVQIQCTPVPRRKGPCCWNLWGSLGGWQILSVGDSPGPVHGSNHTK